MAPGKRCNAPSGGESTLGICRYASTSIATRTTGLKSRWRSWNWSKCSGGPHVKHVVVGVGQRPRGVAPPL